MQNLIKSVLPFIWLGMLIVIFAFGFVLLAYLFVIGSIIGIILFTLKWLATKWQKKSSLTEKPNRKIRIIDIKEWKRH